MGATAMLIVSICTETMAHTPTPPLPDEPDDRPDAEPVDASPQPIKLVRVSVDMEHPDAFRLRPAKPKPRKLRSRKDIAANIAASKDTAEARREVIREATDDPALRAELLSELEAELAEEAESDAADLAAHKRFAGKPEGEA